MRSLLAAILVTATAFTVATARADDDSSSPPKKSEPEESWYGWQTLATDGAAIALAIAAGATTQSTSASGTLGLMSLGTYALGGPTVHLAHEQGGAAAGDLALRLVLPLGGALLGALLGAAAMPASSSCDGDGPCGGGLGGGILGLGAGMLTASIVDAAALGYEPAPSKAHHEPSEDASAVRIVPSVAYVPPQGRESSGTGTVGAIGTF